MSASKVYYRAEYSKTDRSTCKKCKATIKKDAPRISKNSPSPFHDGFVAVWFHVPCFFQKEKGKLASVDDLKGYDELRIDDQLKISEFVKESAPATAPQAQSPTATPPVVNEVSPEMQALMMENNKKLWSLRDRFEKDDVPLKELKTFLEANKMRSDGGRQDLVSRLSDAMLFGVATCPACQQREMVFVQGQYACKAASAYGFCNFKGLARASGGRVDVTPIVPDAQSSFEWIRTWNQYPLLVREKRVVAREVVKEYMRDAGQPLRSMKFAALGALERDTATLQSLIVDNGGTFSSDIQSDIDYVLTTYEDLLRAQQTLPGSTASTFSATTLVPTEHSLDAASLLRAMEASDKKAAQKAKQAQISNKLRQALDLKLALVAEPLLDRLLQTFGFDQSVYLLAGQLPPLAYAKLATPASVFPTPADTTVTPSAISLSAPTSTSEEAQTETPTPQGIKKGNAMKPAPGALTPLGVVDTGAACPTGVVYKEVKPKAAPTEDKKEEEFKATEFESLKEAKVEKVDYEVYDRMLIYADIASNLNKFYRLQIIDIKGNGKQFTFFTRWGRVGEEGNWTKTPAASLADAKTAWAKKWKDKTKNDWNNRSQFEQKPGAYSVLEMEEPGSSAVASSSADKSTDAQGHDSENQDDNVTPSFLDPRLKKLVDMIFDKTMLERSMTNLKIDLKKMPLGKLSRATLIKSYSVLKEIENALLDTTDETARFKLSMLSSQFYTHIPHDFGRAAPDLIDSISLLRIKMKQIETLLDIMVAAQMLNEAPPLVQSNPSDVNYQKLQVKLTPLSSYTRDFKMVQRFVATGYDSKTLGANLEVMEVFKIDRNGEIDRFEPFRNQRPRKLLWHGSRMCNFVGILSEGLRIAPPEAPASGYMFGKAIYLSDLVEKSAPYCVPDPATGIGLLVLCDTALGEPLLLNRPEFITQLPDGKQSAKALSRFQPDPTKQELGDDKIIVPIGAPTPTNLPDVFLDHAEYMVYDAAQVRQRYLVQVKFNVTGTLAAPK